MHPHTHAFTYVKIHTQTHTHTHTHTHIYSCVATSDVDYNALTNFHLGPFSDDVRELSFNVSIVNDSTPEGDEMFRVSLTLDSAGQDRLSSRIRVSPNVATVTIQDDGKQL